MRFRKAEWDIDMPAALTSYWQAWNEPDDASVRGYLAKAVTPDVEWNGLSSERWPPSSRSRPQRCTSDFTCGWGPESPGSLARRRRPSSPRPRSSLTIPNA